jgi:hypothetical protein
MNLAEYLKTLVGKGFSEERAEVIAMMREAAIQLFKAFPDSFLLYGGANLILFHDSTRHSADLDLLSTAETMPTTDDMRSVLNDGLKSLSVLLGLGTLKTEIINSDESLKKIMVKKGDDTTLFTVDLSRMGSVLRQGIQEEPLESLSSVTVAQVKRVSRDFLLLQKAEAFLLRRVIKVRDAYDIKVLADEGASLTDNLKDHLAASLAWEEITGERIIERIAQVDVTRCRDLARSAAGRKIRGARE